MVRPGRATRRGRADELARTRSMRLDGVAAADEASWEVMSEFEMGWCSGRVRHAQAKSRL